MLILFLKHAIFLWLYLITSGSRCRWSTRWSCRWWTIFIEFLLIWNSCRVGQLKCFSNQGAEFCYLHNQSDVHTFTENRFLKKEWNNTGNRDLAMGLRHKYSAKRCDWCRTQQIKTRISTIFAVVMDVQCSWIDSGYTKRHNHGLLMCQQLIIKQNPIDKSEQDHKFVSEVVSYEPF